MTTAEQRTTTRLPALDILRVVAVAGVVAIHVFAAIVGNADVRGSATWWGAVAIDIGVIWVVPAFVMVSGALLLTPRAQDGGPSVFYRRRLLRLGPAFVFWQIFYLLVVRMWMSGEDLTLAQGVLLIAEGRTYTHLYFLWLIVGLYAIAPVLWPFLRDGGRPRALILAGCALVVTAAVYSIAAILSLSGQSVDVHLNALTQWLPYVGYFVAGCALAGVVLSTRWAVVAVLVSMGALAFAIWEYGIAPEFPLIRAVLPVGYTSLTTMAATIGIFLVVQRLFLNVRFTPSTTRLWATLSDASFGVFLVHFAIIILIRLIAPEAAAFAASSLWACALLWAVVVVTSFAIALVARRVPFVRRVF